jgi:nucleoside-diphosphate-sugar epimerase
MEAEVTYTARSERQKACGGESPGRILITGGCGFIGSNLAAHYLARDWEVIAYDTFSRPGDQRVYVSDIRKLRRDIDWRPRVGIDEGLRGLCEWVGANEELFQGQGTTDDIRRA